MWVGVFEKVEKVREEPRNILFHARRLRMPPTDHSRTQILAQFLPLQ
jgi:hypothetical protein